MNDWNGDPETGCGLMLLFAVDAVCFFLAGALFALAVLR